MPLTARAHLPPPAAMLALRPSSRNPPAVRFLSLSVFHVRVHHSGPQHPFRVPLPAARPLREPGERHAAVAGVRARGDVRQHRGARCSLPAAR